MLLSSSQCACAGKAFAVDQHICLTVNVQTVTVIAEGFAIKYSQDFFHFIVITARCLMCVGKCAQIQALPDSNTVGQQHMACKLLHSSKQAAFVFFYRVLEGGGKGAVLTPGTMEWTLVQEIKLGEEKSMAWTLPGQYGSCCCPDVSVLCVGG